MKGVKQKTIYLWSRPRSLSTTVVRAMSTVEGCKAINEPFIAVYFAERKMNIPGLPEWYGKTAEEVLHNLTNITGHKFAFIKEMPGHMGSKAGNPDYIARDCVHTFLIRHPVKTVHSFVKLATQSINTLHKTDEAREASKKRNLTVEAVRDEQTFEHLMTVYDIVTKTHEQKPIVLDADDLQRNPEGTLKAYCKAIGIEYQDSMVNWGPITPEQKDIFRFILATPGGPQIHSGPVDGTQFVQSEPKEVTVGDVDETFRKFVRENLPFYQMLWEHRIKPEE